MAEKITIDIEVNGKMQKATVDAKKLRGELDGLDASTKKAGKSQDKYSTGLKGVGEQSANASKNFSKFSAGMGGFVGVYASLAAQLFAISAGFQFLKRAGDLQALKDGQIAYASATGIAMRTLTKDIQAATNAQVTFQDAAQAGAIGTAAGLSADQITRLGSAAADASQILGRDVTDSFNRLVRGVTKAEPELLDELGIILRLNDATAAYALELGKNANELTQFEKSQAVANDVLTQAEEKYSRILEITGRTPNQFAQLGVAFDDVTNDIKELVSTLAGPMAKVLTDTPALAAAAFGLLLTGPLQALGFSFKDIAKDAEESANRQVKAFEAVEEQQKRNRNLLKDRKKDLKNLAQTEVGAGTNSKILQNLAKGGKLYGVDKANLQKALTAAENQLREHGKITSGIFAGRDAKILASFRTTLDQMDTAIDGTVSTWESANLRIRGIWATTTAFIQRGVAAITRGISAVLRIAGFIGLAVFAIQTLRDVLKDPIAADEDEKKFQAQAQAMEMAKERLKSLIQEYKNFEVVQQVNFEFAEPGTELEVLRNSAEATAKMLATTFAPRNMKAFTQGLIDLNVETRKVESSTKNYEKVVKNLTENTPFVSIAAKIGDAVFKTDKFTGGVELLARGFSNIAVQTAKLGNSLGLIDDANTPIYQLGEDSLATQENLRRSVDALDAFRQNAEKFGASNFQVFENFDTLLDIGKRLAAGEAVSAEEAKRFQEEMGGAAMEAQRLGGNLASVEKGAKAVTQALGAVEAKMKGSTQGDALRNAAESQIRTLNAIRDARVDKTRTVEEEKLVSILETQAALGEEIAAHEAKYKQLSLEQQTNSIRNYATMSKTRGNLLRQGDQIAVAGIAEAKAQAEYNRLLNHYKDTEEGITPEIQRQLDLLDATIKFQQKKGKLAEEEFLTLVKQNTILERQEALRDENKIQGAQKIINDGLQKEVQLRRQIMDSRMQIAREGINQAAADAEVANPFFDKEQFIADENLRLEKETYAARAAQIESEYQLKLQQIDLEYTLLDFKREQTMLEMQKLALDLEAQGKGPQAQRAAEMAAKLAGTSFNNAKEAAVAMAQQTKAAALFNLNKGVKDAERVVKALEPIRQIMKTAAGAFEGALNDSINALFDSLSDKTLDLSEKLKEIGRNLLQTIQKAVTQRLLVDPLLNMLGLGTANQAQKIARAHADGASVAATTIGTTFDTGATTIGTAISTALATQIKVCCCDEPGIMDGVALAEFLRKASIPGGGTGEDSGRLPDGTVTGPVFGDVSSHPINQPSGAAQATEETKGFFSSFSDMILGVKADFVTLTEAGTGLGEIGDKLIIGKDVTGGEAYNLSTAGVGSITEGGRVGGLFGGIKDTFKNFSESLGKFFSGDSPFLKSIGDIFGNFGGMFQNLLGSFGNIFSSLGSGLGSLFGSMGGGISSLLGMIPGVGPILGGIGTLFGFKDGGIMDSGRKVPGYATGGIANGSNMGHLAMLHGREAVVPLPNGNSIPVQMQGQGMQNNNVTVNVATDGSTSSSANSSEGANLGQVIAAAVQKELQNQKRAGGILNKHGAA